MGLEIPMLFIVHYIVHKKGGPMASSYLWSTDWSYKEATWVRVTAGVGVQGDTFHREVFSDLPGKERQFEKGNGEKKENVTARVENLKWTEKKVWKWADFFFFFRFSPFENH